MGAGSLAQLHVDLDAENLGRAGVVVDVRNNNGGFVNVYAIDVLARRGYLVMTQRRPAAGARAHGAGAAVAGAADRARHQSALALRRGGLHGRLPRARPREGGGEPTAGWIIYTWGQRLIDGSNLRLHA